MPAKPSWHANLPKIRRDLTAMNLPFVDRAAIERLFGIRRRQANYLMRGLGGYKIGPSAVIDRQELLLRLEQMAGRRGIATAETRRKSSVVEALEALKHQARPRRVTPPPPRVASTSLPAGISIARPGELTIQFSSPEELLGRILALVQSASKDFAGFASGLEPPSPRSCVCTAAEGGRPPECSSGADVCRKEP